MTRGTKGQIWLIVGIVCAIVGVYFTIEPLIILGFFLIGYMFPEALFGTKLEKRLKGED